MLYFMFRNTEYNVYNLECFKERLYLIPNVLYTPAFSRNVDWIELNSWDTH